MRLCIGDQIEINRRFNKEICDWLGDEGVAHAINRIQSLGETEKILHLRLWFGDEEVYWTGEQRCTYFLGGFAVLHLQQCFGTPLNQRVVD